ncbi:MAG: DNA-binding protein VF530 [Bacteroidetes bacterium]|nr:DNA-binding protein VF530 [Bacteroidota bacterium]
MFKSVTHYYSWCLLKKAVHIDHIYDDNSISNCVKFLNSCKRF